LSREEERETFLRSALDAVVTSTGARQGYIELVDDREGTRAQEWSVAAGLSDDEVEEVRARISTGIISEALATGDVIETASAVRDPRFRDRESVRGGQIEAVLCVPLRSGRIAGALYLQRESESGPFAEREVFLAKLFAEHLSLLAVSLVSRIRASSLEDPTARIREELRCAELVGRSRALAELLQQIRLTAPLDVNLLLTGESGTGKSLVARLIHTNSHRVSGPFVEVNCAGIAESLIESELFGHERGAFTGATEARKGRFELATDGTIFLDEVAELSLAAQGKLLRVLQERRFERVGGNRTLTTDARVVAATNRDLEGCVADGSFREDLYYRLHVLRVRIPSLAERREDVLPLADSFLEEARNRHSLSVSAFTPGAQRALVEADWPGNVRQLQHVVHAGAIKAAGEGSLRVGADHLFGTGKGLTSDTSFDPASVQYHDATRRFQKELIARTLEDAAWNVSAASRRLGLTRAHLYNLMSSFQISRPSSGAKS
jgi:Nif-specific regulatory protein